MALITWSEKYSVEIASIDAQHQRLIDLINQLNILMKEGKGSAVVSEVLAELVDYTKEHLANEEHQLVVTGYPDYAQHKKLHDEFIKKINEFQATYNTGKSLMLVITISNFLWDWLSQHILVVDKKYSEHLKQHGIV